MAKRKPEKALAHRCNRADSILKAKPGADTGAAAAQAFEIFHTDAKPSLLTAQYADDFGDLVFLKESNRGDARGPSLEAGAKVI